MKRSKRPAHFLAKAMVPGTLVFLILLQAVLLGLWLRRDDRPPSWDPAVHLMTAWQYRESLVQGQGGALLHTPTFPGHPPYPPVVHLVMMGGMSLAETVGLSPESGAVFFQTVFLSVLILACYLLAAHFWTPRAGLTAAALVSFAPPIQYLSHQALVDLGLTAMVVMAYALWVRSEEFSRRRWTVALAVAGGMGVLTKWTFVTYILPILGSALYRFFRKENRKNIGLALVISALLSAPWYVFNIPVLFPKLLRVAELGAQEGYPSGASFAGWFYYANVIWTTWSGFLVLGGIGGLAWGFYRRARSAAVLAGWFFTGYALWSLVSNKDPRYLIPAAVVLPISMTALPYRIPSLAAIVVTLWALGSAFSPSGRLWMDVPVRDPWPLEEILNAAEERRGTEDRPALLTLVSNHASLNGNTLSWTVMKQRRTHRLVVRTKMDRLGQWMDFILVKTGDLGPKNSVARQEAAREEIFSRTGWFSRSFGEVERWPLPDGSEAVLFERKGIERTISGPVLAGWVPRLIPDLSMEGFQASIEESRGKSGEVTVGLSTRVLRVKGMTLQNVAGRLVGMRVVMDDAGEPRLLALRRLEVRSALWTEEEATGLLRRRLPALRDGRVVFMNGNRLRVTGRWGPLSLAVEGRLGLGSEAEGVTRLVAEMTSLRLAGVPLPVRFLGSQGRQELPLAPTGRRPFEIRLAGLRTVPATEGRPGALEVIP